MRAFVTLLSNDSYLKGVIALKRALQAVSSKYPLFCVLSISVDEYCQNLLEEQGVSCIRLNQSSVDFPDQAGDYFSHWSYTFDKLQIWGLMQFEKIVFLDSDMLILRNIDELFDVIDGVNRISKIIKLFLLCQQGTLAACERTGYI